MDNRRRFMKEFAHAFLAPFIPNGVTIPT